MKSVHLCFPVYFCFGRKDSATTTVKLIKLILQAAKFRALRQNRGEKANSPALTVTCQVGDMSTLYLFSVNFM